MDKNQNVRYYLRGNTPKTRKREREPSPESGDLEDDILNDLLLDVPESGSTTIKPLKLSKMKRNRVKIDSIQPPPVAQTDQVLSPPTLNMTETDDMNQNDKLYGQMATQESVLSTKSDEAHENVFNMAATTLDEDIKNNLEFLDNSDGSQYTRLYWYDCCEYSPETRSKNLSVCFFGRIFAKSAKRFVSCCVIVKNVRRCVYLLIGPDSTYEHVVGEFSHIIAKRYNITNFKCEKVTRKYAFSSDGKVPPTADYVKVEYVAEGFNALPSTLKGETFVQILNVTQSPMEKMILDMKLRGPCWLKLVNPVASKPQLTWTKIELILESPDNLQVEEEDKAPKPPYFSVLSLALQTHAHPTIAGRNDIIAMAVMVNTSFNLDECLKRTNKASGHFLLMTKPTSSQKNPIRLPYDFQACIKDYKTTKFELVNSERELLINFLEKFSNIDPDIVVGHDLLNYDFETLVRQINTHKAGAWSKLGRFHHTVLPSIKRKFPYLFNGRILCDIKKSAEELIQSRSYGLTELCSSVLRRKRIEYDHAMVVESFASSESLLKLLDATWQDVDSIFSILVELNVVPLALKITKITGNILSRTLAAGRSERNEYLLLHAFYEAGFICPEKINLFEKRKFQANMENLEDHAENPVQGRKKAAYTGGLVLEPKTGFYETCILLMDFNSLYPSIIQEFNICFSTVQVPVLKAGGDIGGELIATAPSADVDNGVLPTQLKNLVDRRRQVKKLLVESKQPMEKLLLDIEQRALKLTANSMYGCLGFEHSRFYAKHLASLVTFKGREILMSTKAMVETLGFDVIYGDTDSLMIDTKIVEYDNVIQKGMFIKNEVNKTFKLLEIDIDGVYHPLLLLKKKNYVGASLKKLPDGKIVKTIETKGLDTVRRDRAVIAKEAGEKVLSMILESDKDICQIVENIHNYLKELASGIQSQPQEKFLISKQLNKNPEDYRDTKGIGHVAVALRHNKDARKARKMRNGDTVEYVICTDGTTESANQRCYSLDELASNSALKIDYEYYLCQQIHPIMTRICEKLPITNSYVLAEMLGVESSNQIHIKQDQNETANKKDQLLSKGAARFNTCKPLVIKCPNCNLPDEITTVMRNMTRAGNKELEPSLTRCVNCNIRYAIYRDHIRVQIINMIKQLNLQLYSSRFVCESADCENWTRNVFGQMTGDSIHAMKAQPICDVCQSAMLAEMDDKKVDLQLSYYKHLFNIEHELGVRITDQLDDMRELYRLCHDEVRRALEMSYINSIDTRAMFSMVCANVD